MRMQPKSPASAAALAPALLAVLAYRVFNLWLPVVPL